MPKKDDESPSPRLLPKVTFGLSAAILAGVVVVSVTPAHSYAARSVDRVLTTTTLGAVINSAGGGSLAGHQTTCCGDNKDSRPTSES